LEQQGDKKTTEKKQKQNRLILCPLLLIAPFDPRDAILETEIIIIEEKAKHEAIHLEAAVIAIITLEIIIETTGIIAITGITGITGITV
jgi:hypothetical protein